MRLGNILRLVWVALDVYDAVAARVRRNRRKPKAPERDRPSGLRH